MIYIEVRGRIGVFKVYPGGRTVKYPSTEKFWKRLTPTSEFTTPYSHGEKCVRCGTSFIDWPYARQINGYCMECHHDAGTTWGLLDSLTSLQEETDQ